MGDSRLVVVLALIVVALGITSCSESTAKSTTTTANASAREKALAKALNDCFGCRVTISPAKAKAQYQRAVGKNPNDQWAWFNLGVIAQGSGNRKEAETDFLKAIAIDPKFQSALYHEGMLRFLANDIPGAIPYLHRAVTENPKDACAHWVFGLALNAQRVAPGDHSARNEMRAALKLNPALLKELGSRNVKPNEVPGCS